MLRTNFGGPFIISHAEPKGLFLQELCHHSPPMIKYFLTHTLPMENFDDFDEAKNCFVYKFFYKHEKQHKLLPAKCD